MNKYIRIKEERNSIIKILENLTFDEKKQVLRKVDQSMINSAKVPEARLHKRHNILSFHYVRSLMSQGFINLQHIPSESNIADVLSKHWKYKSAWPLLQPVLHFEGNVGTMYIDDLSEVMFNGHSKLFEKGDTDTLTYNSDSDTDGDEFYVSMIDGE